MNGEDSKQEWRRISSAVMCAEYFACMLFFGFPNVWIKIRIWNSLRSKKYHKQTNAKRSESEWLRMLDSFACYWWFPSVSAPFTATHKAREKKERISHDVSFKSNQIEIAGCFTLLCIAIYCYLSLFVQSKCRKDRMLLKFFCNGFHFLLQNEHKNTIKKIEIGKQNHGFVFILGQM